VQQAGAAAEIEETHAKAGLHQASAFAHVTNALTEAHSQHADRLVKGVEKGMDSVQQSFQHPTADPNQTTQIAAGQQSQASDHAHQASMAEQAAQQQSAAGQDSQES
jgi:hypothetical protein